MNMIAQASIIFECQLAYCDFNLGNHASVIVEGVVGVGLSC